LVWSLLLLAAAVLLPHRVWTTLLVGLGGLVLVAYIWARQLLRGLHGVRRLRFGWVSVGDRLVEEFTLVNSSPLPAFWIEIVDESNVPGYTASIVRSISAQSRLRWREDAICTHRGRFHLGPWSLRSADPFGIFQLDVHYPQHEEIIIHPPILSQLPVPLPAGQSSGRSRARERSWQATVNVASVRDYRPNDPFRWIHWRTSARKDKLYVREFDLDAAGDVWLLLDLQAEAQLGSGPEGTEEHAILLAAALAARAQHQNRAIGLALYGRQPELIVPGQGTGQQWRILRALAVATAEGDTGLTRALRDVGRAARRGSAIVIITPSGSTDWLPGLVDLAQSGVESDVILLDRRSFGGSGNSQALRDAVRQLGFECHLVHRGEIAASLPEGERRGHWEFRTLATGKVVVVKSPGG
jgi:uncharacterized protein (DUF58 family)